MRLEQRDSYATQFEGRVLERHTRDGAPWLRLDASAFYPTSGGQPHDTGRLEPLDAPDAVAAAGAGGSHTPEPGDVAVVDVALRDGAVWHRLERDHPALRPGARVRGRIHWPRRLRHMQRHSAQHLLSQAFVRLDARFETRSVSLSSADCTLDLAGAPGDDALAQAERIVNEACYRNLPIRAFEVDDAELPTFALRRPPKVSGRVRLVQMGDFEIAACGGTHLRCSAEAAPVKLLRRENIRGGLVRVVFRAGLEALDDYRAKHDVVTPLAQAFSARPEELPARVATLRQQLTDAERGAEALRERLAHALAAELRSAQGSTVVHRLADGDHDLLEPLARALLAPDGAPDEANREAATALLGVREASAGGRALLLFGRAEGDDAAAADMRALLRAALPAIEGRGGGRPSRAQGAGPRADGLDEALARASSALMRLPDA